MGFKVTKVEDLGLGKTLHKLVGGGSSLIIETYELGDQLVLGSEWEISLSPTPNKVQPTNQGNDVVVKENNNVEREN